MNDSSPKVSIDRWGEKTIKPGTTVDVKLPVSESYTGVTLKIPIRVVRGRQPGPTIFVTAACHGDELNGTGAIRELILDPDVQLKRGSILYVPILNLMGFDRYSRYLPDRRDLNRCFPGSAVGSGAARLANQIFQEIVSRCDFGIDLHTASVRRTNYPSVRADLTNPAVRELAIHFGGEIILDGSGPKGTLRREACRQGCPTIVFEGGEVWKVEPAIVETAVRGVKNILRHFDMIDGPLESPETQVVIKKAQWVRANHGGFLQFHVHPGQIVEKNQPLATNTNLLGSKQNEMLAPFDGVIIGMTTLPSIGPGEPVCHVGKLPRSTPPDELRESRMETQGLESRTVEELSSNVMVIEHEEDEDDPLDS